MIERLSATPDNRNLVVEWESGEITQLPATYLRREARDAYTRRAKIDNGDIAVAPDLTITALHLVGRGGVNVHFSDGHDRAIYPFAYLQQLSGFDGN